MTLASAWITWARSPALDSARVCTARAALGLSYSIPEDSGLGETLHIVHDAVSSSGANVQDVDVQRRGVVSVYDLWEDSVGDDGVVGLGHVLEGFEEPGVVLTPGPYAAGGQVVGESVEVLVECGVELDPASEEEEDRWDSGGGSPCGERAGSPRLHPSPTSRRRRRRGTRCRHSGARSRGSRRGRFRSYLRESASEMALNSPAFRPMSVIQVA